LLDNLLITDENCTLGNRYKLIHDLEVYNKTYIPGIISELCLFRIQFCFHLISLLTAVQEIIFIVYT